MNKDRATLVTRAIFQSKMAKNRLRRMKEAARYSPATAAPAHFPYRDHRPVSECLPRHNPYAKRRDGTRAIAEEYGYGS